MEKRLGGLTVINGLTFFPPLADKGACSQISGREYAEDEGPDLVRKVAKRIVTGDPLAQAVTTEV